MPELICFTEQIHAEPISSDRDLVEGQDEWGLALGPASRIRFHTPVFYLIPFFASWLDFSGLPYDS
jgi:hypothetical protein